MVWLGIGMMIAVAAIFAALVLSGNGNVRIENSTVQSLAMMALMLVFIFGAIFALGVQ
jgi:hypothetical protein